jgi:V/A-type H+-transporting ATPase subunit E
MDLDAILSGIQKAGHQQITQIEQEAEQQASLIKEKATKDVEVQKDRILSDGRARMNREQALIEQQAIIQSLQIHANARQKLIKGILEKATNHFSDLRSDKSYSSILTNLVEETMQSITPSLINNQKVILHFDPRDEAVAKRIAKKYDQPISLLFDLECNGGCTAETEDGLVSVLNTINSRFEHALPYIKQKISLFLERKYSSS